MTGPVSIFAITEMNMRVEEALRKVRMELFRIGCAPEKIQILKQGYYLQLRFQRQIILADPAKVVTMLEEITPGVDESEVWTKIVNGVHQRRKKSLRWVTWSIAIVFIILILGLSWLVLFGQNSLF